MYSARPQSEARRVGQSIVGLPPASWAQVETGQPRLGVSNGPILALAGRAFKDALPLAGPHQGVSETEARASALQLAIHARDFCGARKPLFGHGLLSLNGDRYVPPVGVRPQQSHKPRDIKDPVGLPLADIKDRHDVSGADVRTRQRDNGAADAWVDADRDHGTRMI